MTIPAGDKPVETLPDPHPRYGSAEDGRPGAPVGPSSVGADDGAALDQSTHRWARLRARSRRFAPVWKPVAMLAASRIVALAVLYTTKFVPAPPVIGGMRAGNHLDRLAAWDGGWYLHAAQYGWPHSVPVVDGFPAYNTLAFFPAFPLAIRVVHALGFGWVVAGLVTAAAFQVLMAVLLWRLARELWGEAAGDRGMALFLFGPGAVTFSLIYSEPMLLAAAAACLLALRHRRWLPAGAAAAVGAAVRPVGVALVLCCLIEAIRTLRSEQPDRTAVVAPLLAPVGLVSWMVYLRVHTGSVFTWFRAEKAWDDRFEPLSLVTRFFEREVTHTGQRLPHILPVAGALFCGVALVLLWRAKPPLTVLVYSVAVVAISESSRVVGLRPRLIETAFPLVLVVGRWLKGAAYSVVLACAGVSLGGLLFLTLATPRFTP